MFSCVLENYENIALKQALRLIEKNGYSGEAYIEVFKDKSVLTSNPIDEYFEENFNQKKFFEKSLLSDGKMFIVKLYNITLIYCKDDNNIKLVGKRPRN